ncbi:hypothetical protein HDA32_000771 [Spinactinospora alkalitolerans]|uniref:DUF1579 domain-containing protein n=1 Tax=Spinactinospora alkalitolerans TaxID=687207 RepID=A0A852TQ54_9ACTN|nr:DUF1579 family protein [Spinactinospora alkalitolerans]NYE45651.1 hypothetical protein [Spinactinospora alkalitolerans]
MDVKESLSGLVGDWTGTNRLRMMPGDAYGESAASATVSFGAKGSLATIAYTWAYQGGPHEGLLVIGNGGKPDELVAVWADSWHQGPQWMECRGAIGADGVLNVRGSYAEDAGWRIRVDPNDPAHLRLAMDNIMPGADYQVVEAIYSRPE